MLLPPSSCRLTPVTKPDSRAREVDARVGDVGGLAEPGEVHPFERGAAFGREVGVAAVVEHVAGADRVAPDAVRGLLHRDRPGEPVQPGLGRDVRGETGARAFGLAGGDVDDRAVTGACACAGSRRARTTSAR